MKCAEVIDAVAALVGPAENVVGGVQLSPWGVDHAAPALALIVLHAGLVDERRLDAALIGPSRLLEEVLLADDRRQRFGGEQRRRIWAGVLEHRRGLRQRRREPLR